MQWASIIIKSHNTFSTNMKLRRPTNRMGRVLKSDNIGLLHNSPLDYMDGIIITGDITTSSTSRTREDSRIGPWSIIKGYTHDLSRSAKTPEVDSAKGDPSITRKFQSILSRECTFTTTKINRRHSGFGLEGLQLTGRSKSQTVTDRHSTVLCYRRR